MARRVIVLQTELPYLSIMYLLDKAETLAKHTDRYMNVTIN